MKKISALFLLLAICAVIGWSQTEGHQPPPSQAAVQAELENLERLRAHAFEAGDADFIDRTTADECTFVHAAGDIQTKAHELGIFKTHNFKYQLNHLDEISVRLYGDTAVLNGLSTQKGSRDGVAFEGRYRFTRVYVKDAGGWKLVASHVVSVPDKSP
jgi:ketosteroid isomerase-like protein